MQHTLSASPKHKFRAVCHAFLPNLELSVNMQLEFRKTLSPFVCEKEISKKQENGSLLRFSVLGY
jgi:hypothetical protein